MTSDQFDELLHQWARLTADRRPEEGEGGYLPQASHPLSRMGSPPKLIRQRTTMDRGGVGRRRTLAQAAVGASETLRMRIVPATFVDAVPCTETRTMRDPGSARPLPAEVERVDRAWLRLHRINKVRALCLQARYRTRGDAASSAAQVSQWVGEPVGVNRYRNELQVAKACIQFYLAE